MTPLFRTRNRDATRIAVALARVAPTDLALVLAGETGVGKSYLARAIHRRSRPGAPFIVVDCGAIPETLLAAELFGHRAGAFTDATRAREGWLARTGNGTLVLDRVDALPPAGQVTLLRVLEERVFYPVGAVTPRRFAGRVLATASAEIDALLGDGSVRVDLYHRLAGFRATLPALRHRPEDIVPFARAAARACARRMGATRTLGSEAEALIEAYPWPGNFRELSATVERGCLQADGERIEVADLGLPADGWPALAGLAGERGRTVQEVVRLYGLFVLAQHGGNVSRAARALGVSRRTVIRWRRTA